MVELAHAEVACGKEEQSGVEHGGKADSAMAPGRVAHGGAAHSDEADCIRDQLISY
jgi:hypothetical protein